MKVLQILPEMNAGGVEMCVLETARHLVNDGHEAIVVSNGGRLVGELEKAGARHVAMPVHRKSIGSLLQVLPLRRLLMSERPDILHIASRVPGWIAWLACRGTPIGGRPHFVSTVHGFYSVNSFSSIMTRGERVIAVSESIRDYIMANYPRTPVENIRVIPGGVEPERYARGFQPDIAWMETWRREQSQCEGKILLTLPGRITRLKGHGDFFQLIAGLKQSGLSVHGLVVGDTHPKKQAYLAELRARAIELGVGDGVSFLGHRNDLREILAVSDVVLSLSQQPESFGRTVLETLALGRMFVGYDHGGVGEQLRKLFPQGGVKLGDQTGLLAVTRRVLTERPAPGVVGEPYTLDCMCRSILNVYQEIVSHP